MQLSNDPEGGSGSQGLTDGAADGGPEPRRRRWFGRRRTVTPPAAESPSPSGPPEPDWNALVSDTDTRTWAEWAPAAGPDGEHGAEGAGAAPEAAALTGTEVDWSKTSDPLAADAQLPESGGAAAAAPAAAPSPPSDARSPSAGEPTEEVTVAVWEMLSGPPTAASGSGAGSAPPAAAGAAGTGDGAAAEAEDEEPQYRTTLSWPPPRKPRIGAGILSLAVMVIMVALLVTNGQIGTSGDGERETEDLPALPTDPEAVPKDWIVYRHPSAGFGVSYPPGWTVRDEGSGVEIRDPSSRAQLRIEQHPRGRVDPKDHWLEQERTAIAETPDYRRLQLAEARYQGHSAALWEYVFTEGNAAVHGANLQFVTKKDRFILNFRGPINDWQGLLPTFQGFLSSFRTPK